MRASPVTAALIRDGAASLPYGPPEEAVEVCAACEMIGTEYAALRKHAGIFDQPHRGVLRVTGDDRVSFLNNMLSQRLVDLPAGAARSSFWLTRQGRISSDMRVLNLGDAFLLEMDVHAVDRTRAELDGYIIADDVEVTDVTESHLRFGLHGPGASGLLEGALHPSADQIRSLEDAGVQTHLCAGAHVVVHRHDALGVPGYELIVSVEGGDTETVGQAVWGLLAEGVRADPAAEGSGPGRAVLARPIGWHAFNMARVEGGTAMYNVDFGPTTLPHETGPLMADRVDLTKGCYLGQEIVARMEARGGPSKVLCALVLEGDGDEVAQPGPGAAVELPTEPGKPIGAVTSSTVSPMMGSRCVAFGMVKRAHVGAGTEVVVRVGEAGVKGVIREGLGFLD